MGTIYSEAVEEMLCEMGGLTDIMMKVASSVSYLWDELLPGCAALKKV
jgi:hypothetical protein